MKLLYYILLVFFCIAWYPKTLNGQTGTDFWFVAPEVSSSKGPENPVFTFSTYQVPADILIQMPANPAWQDTIIRLDTFTSIRWNLQHRIAQIENKYSTAFAYNGQNNKGIYITTQDPSLANHGEITVTYSISNTANAEVFVLKGQNALGGNFFLPFQNEMTNFSDPTWLAPPYSAADLVVATPNTNITIEVPAGKRIYPGIVGPTIINLTGLDPGDTYTIIPDRTTPPKPGFYANDIYGRSHQDHLGGVRVYSNNGGKFAITIKDDALKSLVGNTNELIGNQIIPVDKAGNEYIAFKGQLNNSGTLNTTWYDNPNPNPVVQGRIYITATGITTVSIWGANYPMSTGEVKAFPLDSAITHIIATGAPIYVAQISGFGNRLAYEILPPIDRCSGSTDVVFGRWTTGDFYMNLIVRNGAEGMFLKNGMPDTNLIKPAKFIVIPGTDWKVLQIGPPATNEIPLYTNTRISNKADVFHLGFLNGSATIAGARMGYVTNYNELDMMPYLGGTRDMDTTLCYGESIQLVANGGTDYIWTSDTSLWLDNAYSRTPKARPLSTATYTVNATGACNRSFTRDFTVHVSAPYEARFTVDTNLGCSPMTVEFHDQSRGVHDYFWDYAGVLEHSTIADADTIVNDSTWTRPFFNNGTASRSDIVTLITKNNFNCFDTLSQIITVYPQPVAAFTASDTVGCHPLPVDFTHTPTVATSYYWDFGGEGSSNQSDARFTFQNFDINDPDTFDVQFITGFGGVCADTAWQQVVVYPRLEPNFSIDRASGCTPLDITISNNSVGSPDSLRWDFFGSISPGPPPNTITRQFTNNSDTVQKQYIELWISNSNCADSVTRHINVFPAASARFDNTIPSNCQPIEAIFEHNPENGVDVALHWDFDDGTSASSDSLVHTFTNLTASDITRTVTLVATTDSGCTDTSRVDIDVYALVDAEFSLVDTSGCAPFAIDIINQSQGDIDSLVWNYGDGSPPDTASLHTYNNITNVNSNHSIRLVVANSRGCTDTAYRNVLIYPQIFAGYQTIGDIYEGCQPLTLHFVDTTNLPATILSWDFADGSGSDLEIPTHTFYNPGEDDSLYVVSLRAQSPEGCWDVAIDSITVYPKIEAKFSIANADSCSDSKSPFTVRITNQSTGGVRNYHWQFGVPAEGTSNVSDPLIHTYRVNNTNSTIIDTLWLRVNNDDHTEVCRDSTYRLVTLRPEVVAAFAPDTTIGCNQLTVPFVNNTNTAANRFYWTFGDSLNAYTRDTTIVFANLTAADKNYPVTLFAWSDYSVFSCTDTAYGNVTVYPFVKADFSVSDNAVCWNTPITLTNNSSPGTDYYEWDLWGDSSEVRNDPVTFDYNWSAGTQDGDTLIMWLHARDANNCWDSQSKEIIIYPQVRPRIEPRDTTGCQPFDVKFRNRTENADATDVYKWQFGNGSIPSAYEPTTQTFINEEKKDSTYDIILYAEDRVYGCFGYDTTTVTVHANPKALFFLPGDASIHCPPFGVTTIDATDLVTDYPNNYLWDFGDDSTSNHPGNVSNTYYNDRDKDTTYTLKLTIVTNTTNCTDSFKRTITVFPQVTAAFATAPDTAQCSPFAVEFDASLSNNEDVYAWDFGNEEFSDDAFPRVNFVNEGTATDTFVVELITRSLDGCSDTARQPIVVYPQPHALFYSDKLRYYYPDSFYLFNETPDREAWQHHWIFDDGTESFSDNNELVKFYNYWGIYNVWLKVSGDQCADSVMRTLEVMAPMPVAAFDSSAGGCTPFTFTVWDSSRYAYTLKWYLDDSLVHIEEVPDPTEQVEPSGRTFELTVDTPGTYNLSLQASGDGGIHTHNHQIEVYKTPLVEFSYAPESPLQMPDNALILCNNTSDDTEGNIFVWTFRNTESLFSESITEAEPFYNFESPGDWEIWLRNISVYGCTDSVMHPVRVEVAKDFSIPTAFMPSLHGPTGGWYDVTNLDDPTKDDGTVFHPVTEGVESYNFRIYTRWGQLVFESNEVGIGWDGYIKGKLAQQDVYVWRANLKFQDGSVRTYSGDVTLIHGKGKIK